ncbi:hypothetical protein CN120_23415 [Sinorhizobium meliloti]|uniref:hypothetical protein n=1 Tax=Rhizobium meliloti TaxID=382 RepID=UPI000FDBCF46|nr:hypothetical protein [Sinorhizobium meliloti]RVN00440.1 hypothetical protein CN120_23415 [Sinorhizobium meliloti]
MSASEVKAELLERWGKEPVAQLCANIVDFISSLPADERRLFTYGSFMKATNRKATDEELLRAIAILVNSKVAALDTWALFTDEHGEEHEITPKDFSDIRRTGVLVHPESGELVTDFEDHIMPFFVPTERLAD